jgi:hypothetical protein
MLISWNNFNIFKYNNTYLHLYEITCKHVYETSKTQKLKFLFWKDKRIPKNIEKNTNIYFSFDTFGSIRTSWNFTFVKCLVFKNSNLELFFCMTYDYNPSHLIQLQWNHGRWNESINIKPPWHIHTIKYPLLNLTTYYLLHITLATYLLSIT